MHKNSYKMGQTTKIGIIKEGKIPIDRRVPLTPSQAKQLQDKYQVEIKIQASDIRCFSDEDYKNAGLSIVSSLEDSDIILGVKEIPIDQLITGKTYFFFSHTIKEQAYNRELLQVILARKIRLIDWETLTNEMGQRVIAFGRWAGIVGAYNGLWTYGKKYRLFELKRAYTCFNYEELKIEFKKIKLPNIKIGITGGGRVSKGAIEVLNYVGIRQVTPHEYLTNTFDVPVFTQLNSRDYHKRKDGGKFEITEFYEHPERYESDFLKYAQVTELLIAGAFWNDASPVLFHRKEMLKNNFKLKVIADITCDIEGSIPSTKRASTIDDPIYDYNPKNNQVEHAFSDESNTTVMAVDNLPCELARDASESFGKELIKDVIPHLLGSDEKEVIERATITKNGKLKTRYSYLQDFVARK